MSSEISKTELRKQRDQKMLKKKENLKGGHLIDAKNQILIISENLIGRHLAKVKRVTLSMYRKLTGMHRLERDP